jgi:hypothetical protein
MKRIVMMVFTIAIGMFCFHIFIFELRSRPNESRKYALLIGGGITKHDTFKSHYKNIEYVANTLKKLGYNDGNIKILFYGGKSSDRPIVEGKADKKCVIDELSHLEKIIDSNDSLLIFRSGHGIIELIFEQYGILSMNENVPENENIKVVGTASVMCFPDGSMSYLEFQEKLGRIRAKQIVVILNQCFSGEFTNITNKLGNTAVISETGEVGIAFTLKPTTKRWEYNEWSFVKCICDGFLENGRSGEKRSVLEAFHYMIKCNPNVEGVGVQADRPILKENPQINYGRNLKKGTVYIH